MKPTNRPLLVSGFMLVYSGMFATTTAILQGNDIVLAIGCGAMSAGACVVRGALK